MARIELVRFLSGNAGEALKQAQYARPELAKVLFKEAEECLALAMSVLNRPAAAMHETREAA